MKTVLHIITGLENGGAEAVLYRLVTKDTNSRHSVVSLMGMGKYGPMLEEQGISVYCLDMPRGGITWKGVISLWKYIRSASPDILQTWMYHADLVGGIVGRFAGVENIYWCIHNSTLLRKSTSFKTRLVTKFCAVLSYVLPKKIISCAQNAIEVNVSQGYQQAKFSLVPNGYDLKEFTNNKEAGRIVREKWRIDENIFLVGMVARFDPQKDIPNLISALGILVKQSVSFHLLLVGLGMEVDNLELTDWLTQAGIINNVTLIGQQNNIPAIMNALDILALSSSYGEAFPNVLCEAMACGTPCVATSVGDSAFIISDKGWVVPPGNSQLLADAVIKAFNSWEDKAKWGSIQESAQKRIRENFSVERMVKGYRTVWGI